MKIVYQVIIILFMLVITSCKPEPISPSTTPMQSLAQIPVSATNINVMSPLATPINNATPTISLDGVSPSSVVKVYTDSACKIEVGGSWASSSSVTVKTSPLKVGQYAFYTKSFNFLGFSSQCSTIYSTYWYAEPPSAPVITSATLGSAQASVTFSAPITNGGASIISYTVISNPSGIIASGTRSPIIVAGLTNGLPYTFTVSATNAIGAGPSSAASDSVIPVSVPDAPTIGSATSGNSQASIAFTAPVSNSGSTITSYKVTSSPGGLSASGVGSPLIVTGLTNGVAYTFTATATNAIGESFSSAASNIVIPATVPAAPTIGAAIRGNAQASVAFLAPSNGGLAITSYTVTSSPGGFSATGATSPIVVNGLTNGSAYTFTVTATNAVGASPPSAASNSVTPAIIPGAPNIGSATRGNTQASVTFSAPASNGGSAITSYTVTSSPGGLSASGAGSPIVVTGLTNGVAYTFTVTATNAAGAGLPSSATNSVIPATVPAAPTIGAAIRGNVQASVSFSAPASNGGSAITSYTVTSNPGGFTSSGTGSPLTVTGLTNGAAYTFTATATNAIGASSSSAASNSVTPATFPGTPIIGAATSGNAQASVAFSAPVSNGGSVITSYMVTSSPGGLSASGAGSPIVVNGLTNGVAYTFTVKATNVIGASTISAASNSVTPATFPGTPTIGAATSGNTQASVTFSAPASNGGSAISSYTVTSSPGGFSATGATSPIVVNGLTNGVAYTFTVKAINAFGASLSSAASNSVIPVTTPDAPVMGLATPGNTQADVSFTTPTNDGGSPITSYTITSNPGNITSLYLVFGIPGAVETATITGLTNGISYTFTVVAANAIGNSAASAASNSVTPSSITVPGAPTIGTATRGNTQASVTFSAPASDGGSAITSYTATSNPGGFTSSGAGSPLTINGLTNGAAYTFTVRAINAIGASSSTAASNSVTPATFPGPPNIGSATRGNTLASVTFTAPASNGGSAITSYTVTSNPGGFTSSGTGSPLTVTGLTNGAAYTFSVTAANAIGASSSSADTNSVTPATIPGAPTIGAATGGNAQASVTFSAPASDGGSAVTSYTATSIPGGFTATGVSSPLTVNGLTNGTTYTFTVKATNAMGIGPASSASNSVTLVTNDPLFAYSWHLYNIGQTNFSNMSAVPGIDLNLMNTWALGYKGQGVNILVSDSGVESGHEDLAGNFLGGTVSKDFTLGVAPDYLYATGEPVFNTLGSNAHGTMVAGIIAAVGGNSIGSLGVAPLAKIASANNLKPGAAHNSNSLLAQVSGPFNIINQSFSTPQCLINSPYSWYESKLKSERKAYVKSAGNSFKQDVNACSRSVAGTNRHANSNFDGMNTNPYTIVVAALNASGVKSSYSTTGSNIWISGFGGEYGVGVGYSMAGQDGPAIMSTDIQGCVNGESPGSFASTFNSFLNSNPLNINCNYTSTMNGTSAAAPTISGSIALILSANNTLSTRDIKHIIASTAVKNDSTASATNNAYIASPAGHVWEQGWITNAAGYHFHNYYGFGMMNVDAAVAMATSSYVPLAAEIQTGYIPVTGSPLNFSIPVNSASGVTSTINIPSNLTIETIQIQPNITHPNIGRIGIELTSPAGTKSILLNVNNSLEGLIDIVSGETFLSNAFYGENSSGNWTIKVLDGSVGTAGTLNSWSINVTGH